jgi:hypothetical protein
MGGILNFEFKMSNATALAMVSSPRFLSCVVIFFPVNGKV